MTVNDCAGYQVVPRRSLCDFVVRRGELLAKTDNVCTNHAVVLAAMVDQCSHGKNNGTTTTIHFKKGSVVVCGVMRHATDVSIQVQIIFHNLSYRS